MKTVEEIREGRNRRAARARAREQEERLAMMSQEEREHALKVAEARRKGWETRRQRYSPETERDSRMRFIKANQKINDDLASAHAAYLEKTFWTPSGLPMTMFDPFSYC